MSSLCFFFPPIRLSISSSALQSPPSQQRSLQRLLSLSLSPPISPSQMPSFSLALCPLLLLIPLCRGAGPSAGATELWCVAKNNADDASLQSALDWACGAGGADCSPIQAGGPCYDSGDVQNMASFAFNDYFIKHGTTDDACFFQNAAAITSLNPSYGNCRFPSSLLRNGNFSSQTTAVGLGPSEDISGSDLDAGRVRVWPMVIGYLFFIIIFQRGNSLLFS